MRKPLWLAVAALAAASCAAAEPLDFPPAAIGDPAALAKAMPALAEQVIAVYKDEDRRRYLDNLFRLQLVAGRSQESLETLASLRFSRTAGASPQSGATNVQYEMLARAKVRQSVEGLPFEEAFQRAFRETMARLDDRTSALVIRTLTTVDPATFRQELQGDLERQTGKSTIELADALRLIRAYQVAEAYRSFTPLTAALVAEDDGRRYQIDKDVPVKAPDGATVCALIVRPRAASGRLPALLNFTIYVDPSRTLSEARRSASNGYAGVEGFTRGKGCSPDQPVPYEHDGADAAALIDWISAQPWSDGRVGMYGGSYEGFTQWAAAKRMPKALKALMPGAPVGPGIDVPMEGNVVWSFVYPWTFYTLDNKTLDDATYNDNARWRRLNHDWYVGGRAYRALASIDGAPNPIFERWIAHPSYDAYWQGMIPYQKDFARIDIPVLETAGYYYGGPGAAVYYFDQHYKYNPHAKHYLVIGPYDHIRGHRGTVGVLGDPFTALAGYELDPVAQLDMGELRYQWFDYVFKGAPKPALLQDKVSYQVTGANVWKHAPSLAAMARATLRLHLSAERSGTTGTTGTRYRLSGQKPPADAFIPLTVDLADRSDIDRIFPGGGISDQDVNTWNGIAFVSDPLPKPTELSGLLSGRLDFVANKKDFDFNVSLYELTPQGRYVQLAPYWARASYAGDASQRHLLTPGKRQRLEFRSRRLMSRQLQAGSRVVMVLNVIKEPGRQINYGTGKDVSDETIADAKEPLQIKWFAESYVDLPVGR